MTRWHFYNNPPHVFFDITRSPSPRCPLPFHSASSSSSPAPAPASSLHPPPAPSRATPASPHAGQLLSSFLGAFRPPHQPDPNDEGRSRAKGSPFLQPLRKARDLPALAAALVSWIWEMHLPPSARTGRTRIYNQVLGLDAPGVMALVSRKLLLFCLLHSLLYPLPQALAPAPIPSLHPSLRNSGCSAE